MSMRRLEDGMYVAGQIDPDDMTAIAARGIRLIVNNRPDGEEPGQPPHREIAAAAEAAGIACRHIPVARLEAGSVEAMAAALEGAAGPVLAFCRSGTRSAYLWALARSQAGAAGDDLAAKAAAAGYDLGPIRRFLR
jgi:uncharacterized protein (TIGR01244 family)